MTVPAAAGTDEADGTTRWAAHTYAGVVVLALPLYLVLGRDQWFINDEWDFLAGRDGGSLHSLLAPHNEHWSTLPILVYRVLWTIFGLRSYVPYQVLSIATHLLVAVLLRVVMRRAGVHPWLATSSAAAFVLFGSGYQDIIWGFQIGYVGAIAFGLGQLLLADHDGPIDRRDGAAVACGIAALLCAGTAVTMVVVVGLAVVIRRGVRPALLQTAPAAAVFLGWWLGIGRDEAPPREDVAPGDVVSFVVRGLRSSVGDMTHYPLLPFVLVVAAGIGALLIVTKREPGWRARIAAPFALAVGSSVFFTIAAFGRADEVSAANKSRYVHVGLTLLLPALTVAVDALVRRWPVLLVPASALFLIGVPGNIGAVKAVERPMFEGRRSDVVVLAGSDVLDQFDSNRRPFQHGERNISVGWLHEGRRSGRIPAMDRPRRPIDDANALSMLALGQNRELGRQACEPARTPSVQRMATGGQIRYRGVIDVRVRAPGGVASDARTFSAEGTARVRVRAPVDVIVRAHRGGKLCR